MCEFESFTPCAWQAPSVHLLQHITTNKETLTSCLHYIIYDCIKCHTHNVHTTTFPNTHTQIYILFLYTIDRSAEVCKYPQMKRIVREIFEPCFAVNLDMQRLIMRPVNYCLCIYKVFDCANFAERASTKPTGLILYFNLAATSTFLTGGSPMNAWPALLIKSAFRMDRSHPKTTQKSQYCNAAKKCLLNNSHRGWVLANDIKPVAESSVEDTAHVRLSNMFSVFNRKGWEQRFYVALAH